MLGDPTTAAPHERFALVQLRIRRSRRYSPEMKSRCTALLVVGAALAIPARAVEPPCALPAVIGDGWRVASPESSGFDTEALCATLASVAAGEANLHSVIVERHDRLVAELYRKGQDLSIDRLFGLWRPFSPEMEFGPTTRHDLRSVSKSVIGLLVGIARQQGKIGTLAAPVLDFYPQDADLRSPEREAIHLEHLLTMSSGLEWDEGALPNDETRLYWSFSPVRFVLSRPIVAAPGRSFNYNSGGTAVLADILIRTSGKPLTELVRTELFEPLGITDWEWVSDLHGRSLAFTGLRMRPRDLVKLGRMLLDHGQWRGQQIVPAEWVEASLRPHVSTPFRSPPTAAEDLEYGYQWWVGSVDWRGKQVQWSAGFGNGGQRLFVVPELDLTVVITAGAYGSPQINHTVNALFERIVSAVRE